MYWVNEKDAKTAFGGGSVGWVWNIGGKHWPNPEVSRIQGGKSDFLGILNGKSYRALSTNWERRLAMTSRYWVRDSNTGSVFQS